MATVLAFTDVNITALAQSAGIQLGQYRRSCDKTPCHKRVLTAKRSTRKYLITSLVTLYTLSLTTGKHRMIRGGACIARSHDSSVRCVALALALERACLPARQQHRRDADHRLEVQE